MKGYFVCIIGIDGSGKTTLSRNIIRRAADTGLMFHYVWGKSESLLIKFIIRMKNTLLVREKEWRKNYQRSRTLKQKLLAHSVLRMAYEGFFWCTYWGQVFIKIYLPLRFGQNILCDRYIYDTMVDMAIDLGYPPTTMVSRLRQMIRIFPRPDLILHIHISPQVAFTRKQDIPSLQWLEEKQTQYKQILRNLEVRTLEGETSMSDLASQAQELILNRMGTRKI